MNTRKLSLDQINSLSWQQLLAICLAKHDYDIALYHWKEKQLKRIFFRKPTDPCPALPAEGLAIRYVAAFNKCKGCGRRVSLGGASTLFLGIRYDSDTFRPVISATYYDENDGCAYDERYLIERTGEVVQLNIPYPISEMGIKGLPDKPGMPELKAVKEKLPILVEEVRQVVMNWNLEY